ncbi:pyridoxamine 5'-phosphate oxidase family protein [Nocardia sp. NPDC059177]|uniref:pyridoxamine 5'-phosphate oxidase family protein n=1 Tax=Nocardia sp. NPDC059177 TaxID=3346759 RepID=UPI0036A74F4B
MAVPFDTIADKFVQFTDDIVWCAITTVDGNGRPRSRVLHPMWEFVDGKPVGWIVTPKSPIKVAHLEANPTIAFSYWSPAQNTVQGEAVASWVTDPETEKYVWDLFMTTPPPRGYNVSYFAPDGPSSPEFCVLRLDPVRVQILDAVDFPRNTTPVVATFDA